MSTQSAQRPDVNQVRQAVRQMLNQARKDQSYREGLFTDPRGTLIQSGVSEEAADHLIKYELPQGFAANAPSGQDVDQAGQMSAQLYCHATCDFWSCIITTCTWFTGV